MPSPDQQNGSETDATEELRRANQKANGEIPALEWIIGGLGLALVSGVIGFLLYQAIGGQQTPPEIRLQVQSIAQTRLGYRVLIAAVNQGGTTAEGVVIEGELKNGKEPLERSHTTIDYLPPGSEKRAGLFFMQDPRQFDLQVRPLGYEDP